MRRFGGRWAEPLARIEAWLLPAECLLCSRTVLEPGEPLACRLCRARWHPVPHPRCDRCGQPKALALDCRVCREWPRDLVAIRSAVLLDPPVRDLLHRFKYEGWRRLAAVMAPAMAPLLEEAGPGDLVPVPMGRRRLLRRGYNQAAELAAALAALTGRRHDPGRLWRTREAPSQTRLGQAARAANLAGGFAAREAAEPLIVVDDVFTTGATLVSAATACLDAGADRVGAVTFARAEAPLAAAARRQVMTLNPGA